MEIKLLILIGFINNYSMNSIFYNKQFIEKNSSFLVEFNKINEELNKNINDFKKQYYNNKYFLKNNYELVIKTMEIILQLNTKIEFQDENASYILDIKDYINNYKNYTKNLHSLLVDKECKNNTISKIDFYIKKIDLLKPKFKELETYLENNNKNLLNNELIKNFYEICDLFNEQNKYIEKTINMHIPKIGS